MKVLKKKVEILNDNGDLVKIIYHYDDGSIIEREIFVSASFMANRYKPLKG